ncbi:unnamed protein product [Notodromas monacha]|uniref:Uncharacterized protein n=1 Tax=Notodromas monacha TaxID=399045 RepID=A0A7R9BZZ2_9CRUS|nr:unnamed protein product [Notodromas monacha]CAG0923674.1 unnamed protein product [Notodromas monacha]
MARRFPVTSQGSPGRLFVYAAATFATLSSAKGQELRLGSDGMLVDTSYFEVSWDYSNHLVSLFKSVIELKRVYPSSFRNVLRVSYSRLCVSFF